MILFIFFASYTFSTTIRKDGRRFEDECVICFDNYPNVAFSPCKHICVCSECFSKSDQSHCVVCRAKIKKVRAIHGRELNKMKKARMRSEENKDIEQNNQKVEKNYFTFEEKWIQRHLHHEDPRVEECIQENLFHEDPRERLSAFNTMLLLVESTEQQEKACLIASLLLEDGDEEIRIAAGNAVCTFGKGDACTHALMVKLVCGRLKDTRPHVVIQAIKCLAQIASPDDEAFQFIKDVLHSSTGKLENGHLTDVGSAAKDALGYLRRKSQ